MRRHAVCSRPSLRPAEARRDWCGRSRACESDRGAVVDRCGASDWTGQASADAQKYLRLSAPLGNLLVVSTTVGATANLVRRARGMGQEEVAAAAGLSQGTLSKFERGLVAIDEDRLQSLADALDIPLTRLTGAQPSEAASAACQFHRKRSSLPVSEATRIRALLDLSRAQVEDLLGSTLPKLALKRTSLDLAADFGPIDAAREARELLQSAPGPIVDLAAAAEAAGVLILRRDLGTDKIDAIGTWPKGHRPMFLLNTTASADRQRFTLAHELGHAVMHERPADNQEAEADSFASELLMPARQIRSDLTDVTLARLVALKQKWRVSIAALVRRAHDLDAISDHQYRELNIALSTAGYRKHEPVDIAPDIPAVITATLAEHLEHEGPTAVAKRFGMGKTDLAAITGGTA